MKKSDLEVGYVVVHRSGFVGIVAKTYGNFDNMVIIDEDRVYTRLEDYRDDLTYGSENAENPIDIVKVYGLCRTPWRALDASVSGRRLLWERKEEGDKNEEV